MEDNLNTVVDLILRVADEVLSDFYVRRTYRDVIIPMIALCRFDALLAPTKQAVVEKKASLDREKVINQDDALYSVAGQAFYNTSPFQLCDLKGVLSQQELHDDFENYLDGFSPNIQEILNKFGFRSQIQRLSEANIISKLIERFINGDINLSPKPRSDLPGLDNQSFREIFEELARRFDEENNEASEHWKLRSVIKLMDFDAKNILDDSFGINLKLNLKKIKSKAIRQQGERFCANLETVNQMIALPSKLLAILNLERSMVFYDTKARILAKLSANDESIYEDQYSKELDKLMNSDFLPQRGKIVKEAVEGGKNDFLQMLENNDLGLQETYEAILYSGTVWIWCNYEVLMKELWEYALNKGTKHITGPLLKGLTNQEQLNGNLRGKYISLDYLAKYNYNLSGKLGTMLLNKFDFTSCNAIYKAYDCAFTKNNDIKNALCRKELRDLEAARNVIVHNAGIIDATFCKRTATSAEDIGKKLSLNNNKVTEYANAVMDVGIIVMLSVSSNISSVKSETKK